MSKNLFKKKNRCRFYLVRHGETKWNVEGKIQGHADSLLTKEGISQAEQAAKQFKNHQFAAAFSSDLLRAKRTGEIIAAEHKLVVESTHLLREKSYGKFAGIQFEDFKKRLRKQISELRKLSEEQKFKHSLHKELESDEAVMMRALTFLRQVALAYQGKEVLVVTHRGILRNLLIHLGLARYDQVPGSAFENLSYMIVESDGVEFWVVQMQGINFVSKKDRVFELVAEIERGKVASYGEIARVAGSGARAVGKILHGNTDPDNYPCHRVVRADGSLAEGYVFGGRDIQRKLLEGEGVKFKGKRVAPEFFMEL